MKYHVNPLFCRVLWQVNTPFAHQRSLIYGIRLYVGVGMNMPSRVILSGLHEVLWPQVLIHSVPALLLKSAFNRRSVTGTKL